MLKKLKIKFKEIIGNKKVLSMPFLGIFLLFLAFGVFYPNPVSLKAALCQNINGTGFTTKPNGHRVPNTFGYQTCRIDEIKVQTDIYPSNGDTNPDNFVRVGKDGTLTVAMKITLNQPDTLTFDSDELDFNSSDDKEISGFSFGVLEKSQNSSKCSKDSKATGYIPLLGNSTTYLYCDFDDGLHKDRKKQSDQVNAGGVLYKDHLNISPSGLRALGMTEAGKTYELYMYPVIWYDGMVIDSAVVINGAGKSMYVQLYETDAAAKADTSPKPETVPAYGANIGSGTSQTEQSNTVMKIIEWVVGFLLGLIQELIYVLFYYFVAPLIQGMLSIRTYTDTFVAVIYPGWEIVRNVCNIIFIVALIAIAMGTLLRVEAYKSKQTLVQLILAALLVNFSLVIGQAILGVADTVQNQFLPNNTEVIRALGKDLMVSYRSIIYGNDALGGNVSGVVRHIIFVFLSAGSFMVFLALAAYLFIRIVMLWVLLMVSPIAYAAGALPSTSKYRTEWWQYFLKYAFFTPIMAFFINLTAIIATQQKTNPILNSLGVRREDFGDSTFAVMVFQVAGNLIMLVFLVVGMKVAEQFSIMGAGKITSFAQKGMYAPLVPAKGLGGFVRRSITEKIGERIGKWSGKGQEEEDRAKAMQMKKDIAQKQYNDLDSKLKSGKLNDAEIAETQGKMAELTEQMGDYQEVIKEANRKRLLAGLASGAYRVASFYDPKVVKEAWKKREHEKDAKAYEPAIGYMQDTLNRIVPAEWIKRGKIPGKKTFHGLVAKRALISKETKELLEGVRTRDDAFKIADAAFDSGDKHLIHAAFKILQHGNWQDDYMNYRGQHSKTHSILKYMKEMSLKMKKNGFIGDEELEVYDDLQETGEEANRFRAYGYRCTDDDGVVRAAVNLEYYENLEKENPEKFKKEMEKFRKGFESAYNLTKVPEFKSVADQFGKAMESGMTFEQLKKLKFGEGQDETLEDAIIQRRFLTEANIKLQRGAAMGHARAMEAAIFADQDPDKGWSKLNLLGLMAMKEMPPTILKAWLSRMHEGQARPLKAFGAVQDMESGKWQLPDFNKAQGIPDPNDPTQQSVSLELKDQHMEAIVRLTQVIKANPQIFTEVVENTDLFGASNVAEFKENFKKFVLANPQYGVTQKMLDNLEKEALAKEEARKGGGQKQQTAPQQPPQQPPQP